MMMWLEVATGFTGALTFVFLCRLLGRHFGDAPAVSAYFSPNGGCTDAVVQALQKARKDILILARSLASGPIVKAILDAKLRGVRVEVVLDRGCENDPTSDLHVLAGQGLVPFLDTRFPSCHDNLILVDGRTVITGSFDFTRQAEEENSDTLLVVAGHGEVAGAARRHFEAARAGAKEFRLPGVAVKPPPAETTKAAEAPAEPAMPEKLVRKAA
jgi:phosphatidylserine/phosphatidylglycerophosphate/cardiolipin synthase-like enzyme